MDACCQLLLSLFNSVWPPSPCGMVQPRVNVGLSTSSNLVNLSEIAPEASLIGDCISGHVNSALLNFTHKISVLCRNHPPLMDAGLRPECSGNGLHSMLLLTV